VNLNSNYHNETMLQLRLHHQETIFGLRYLKCANVELQFYVCDAMSWVVCNIVVSVGIL